MQICNILGHILEYLLSNATVLSVIVDYRRFWFKELVINQIPTEIHYWSSGQFETITSCHHLAIYYQYSIIYIIFLLSSLLFFFHL